MKTNNVRVRFAPSPTGCFHIGSARTALFNWLYARSYRGVFLLRIEDTDKVRNTKQALKNLLDGMRWLGLNWDEGPYYQSKRTKIYNIFLKELFKKKLAYKKNGAIYFSLEGKRYYFFDKYRNSLIEKVKNNPITINDCVRGYVTHIVEEDFILRRSNGDFGFNFVNVVDDITMKITHVIRGEDHLSNTARHIELFRALGFTPPIYTHLPLILNEEGKMSKRKSGSLIDKYIKCHYLPEAVRNFICLLGWSSKDNREIIPIVDIINLFSIENIQSKSAFFDIKKLSHINTVYLRSLSWGKYYSAAYPILAESGLIKDDTPEIFVYYVLDLAQKKAIYLEYLQKLIYFFFIEKVILEKNKQKIINCRPLDRLCEALYALSYLNDWRQIKIELTINTLSFTNKQKKQYYFTNLRMAVSGKYGGIDLIPLLELMGKKRTLIRIRSLLKEEDSSSF